MRLLLACLVALMMTGCRIDAEGTPPEPECDIEHPETCCSTQEQMCTEWADDELLEVWCCSPYCPPGCEGGGCGTVAPYCTGCFCPEG